MSLNKFEKGMVARFVQKNENLLVRHRAIKEFLRGMKNDISVEDAIAIAEGRTPPSELRRIRLAGSGGESETKFLEE